MYTSSSFYLTLPSNVHPENKTGNYTVRLPSTLHLDGAWEVALTECWIPHAWYNVTDGNDNMDPYLNYENEILIDLKNEFMLTAKVRPGYYDNVHQLLLAMDYAVGEQITAYLNTTPHGLVPDTIHEDIVFSYDRVHKKVVIRQQFNFVDRMYLSKKLQYTCGFNDPIMDRDETIAKYPVAIRGGIDALYIYSDIVAPQVVGNVHTQLIRICHITGKHGDIFHTVFQPPNYLPVLYKEITKIDITIGTDTGKVVPFLYGNVICKLHFRKKRFSLL